MKKLVLFAFMCVGPVTLRAQEERQVDLDPVIVSASLMEKRASETGRNLTVIQGTEFRDLPVNSIDELLRYLPGLEIQARGPMGAQSDIILRGGTFQQVLVLVDGLRINDPTTGHFNSYIPISPSEIARVEILKGASSSIYGSEAVGGVVSIITKTFDQVKSEPESMLEGGLSIGEYGLWKLNAGGVFKRDKLTIAGGVLSNNATGQELRGTKGYFHNHTASLSARYKLDETAYLAYRSSYDSRDFAAQNFYTAFVSDTATEKVSGWLHQLEAGKRMGTSTLTLKAGYKKGTDHYVYNNSSLPNQNASSLLQGLLTWYSQWGEHTDLVVGVHYQQREIESNDRGNHSLQQLAPFVSLSRRFGNLTAHPSIRMDWREGLGVEWVPQLNLSYKAGDWQLRASGGKTIRDADFTERFNNYNKAEVTGGSIGNPGLTAERSFSYELGVDWFNKTNWKISAGYFQRNQKDMIDYVPTPYEEMPRKENLISGGSYALAMNLANVTTRGGELDVQYQRVIGLDQKLQGMLGVTLLESRQSGSSVTSFYLSSHARLLLNGAVGYRWKRLNLSVNGLFKQREEREASGLLTRVEKNYVVLNAQAGYELIVRKLSLYVQADNLADTRYSDLLGAVMPGRWVMGGVKFRI